VVTRPPEREEGKAQIGPLAADLYCRLGLSLRDAYPLGAKLTAVVGSSEGIDAQMVEVEDHIAKLEAIDVESPSAPSDVLLAVAAFNADMVNEVVPGFRQGGALGIPEKLKEWLDKLVAKVREIVNKLSDVTSFTITVGTPFTVSASITFARSQGG
jgi:hypothetical protein